MFYFWHTSLVVLFIAVAYWLGYQYGFKKKVKTIAQKKLWKVLKNPTIANGNSAGPIMSYSNKDTSQSEWLRGYRKWQKTNQKLNDPTQK